MQADIASAIQAAREGDNEPLSTLQQRGSAVIPYLAPYVLDHSVDVRRAVVSLLTSIGGRSAAEAAAPVLRDSDFDLQGRAAMVLYQIEHPESVLAKHDCAEDLRTSVQGGNYTAAAILLLGYTPGQASLALLRGLLQQSQDRRTKLHPWDVPVPVSLVAAVAACRLGDEDARATLLESLEQADVETYVFLLGVLRDIGDPAVLHTVSRGLGKEDEIAAGVPSGATPRRRVCDLAVDALVDRLHLAVRFPRRSAGRYSPQEIDEVRTLIQTALPS